MRDRVIVIVWLNDEYMALQKESLLLFEAYCIFGTREFYKKMLCILMEVNKTMYGNIQDVPNKLLDNFFTDLPVVWNVLAADENNSVNRPSMN